MNSERMTSKFVKGILLLILLVSCQPAEVASSTEDTTDQHPPTQTATAIIPTRTPARTPSPSKTPIPTSEGCKYSGSPETFKPASIPDILLNADTEVYGQTSLKLETDIFRFQSYGAASYGSEARFHYTCQQTIPSLTDFPPNILSYCKFENEVASIHVLSGEIRGTPEKSIHESLLRGRKGWVREQGGSWQLAWELNDADLKSLVEGLKLSPFFSAEQNDCQTRGDSPSSTPFCFSVNIPEFLKQVYEEDISYVDCVTKNQGMIWIDPQTQLPSQWKISFSAGVKYLDQPSDEFPYNIWIEMSQKYLTFNEEFDYPEP